MEVALLDELVPFLGQGLELSLLDGDVGPDGVHLLPHLILDVIGFGKFDEISVGLLLLSDERWSMFVWSRVGACFFGFGGILSVGFSFVLPGVGLRRCVLLLDLGVDLA